MNDTFQLRIQQLYQCLYAVIVFLSVLSLSSWNLYVPHLLNTSDRLMLLVFGATILITLLSEWSKKRLVAMFIFSLLIIGYYYLYKKSIFVFVLLAILAGSGMKFDKLLKTDLIARSISVIFIIALSLLKVLPSSGSGVSETKFVYTKFTFGFTYPNILGYLLVIIIITYCCSISLLKKQVFWIVLLGCLIEYLLNYSTGLISLILFFVLYIWIQRDTLQRSNILLLTSSLSIPVFTIISVWIAKYYVASNNWWDRVNTILSLRPPIWQYYLKAMPISFFGNTRSINQYTLGVVGHGAFDGAYIQFLLEFGILSILILFIAVFSLYCLHLPVHQKATLGTLIMVTCISGFPETNGFLVTFSPMFFLIGSAWFNTSQCENAHCINSSL
ncbi:hypothetical protein Nizo2264_1360 [Lactiplantibacillus plantarum]|uniref:hypothetical protein n=1 Tax=Lactiplantibacillus argentoratensis TaxID=271881 RepID=UPI0007C14079|nr:hypothetical protein Nizo2264_1360 [Lactiplantibacillus plantarum]